MAENGTSYIQVNFDQFQVGDRIPCDIYTDNGSEKDLLVNKNTPLSEPLYESLMDAAEMIFIRKQDQERICSFIDDSLTALLQDQSIPPKVKSEKIHSAAARSLKSFFDNPVKENALQAKEVINAATDLILQSDEARKTLFSLAGHDFYTYTHSCNVGIFGVGLAKALMDGEGSFRARKLGQAFFFHDFGKVKVDPDIIQKPGRLTPDEFEEMKNHPQYGMRLLEKFKLLTVEARNVVLQHHEKLDGSGYPKGLSGSMIHPFARICTIVDVFDALTSERSYRDRNTPYEACQIMLEELNTSFDPDILKVFIKLIERSEGE